MKKFALSILIVFSTVITGYTQEKKSPIKTEASTEPINLFEGEWIVEDAYLLPTYLQDNYKKYLKAKLFFGSKANNFFGNTADAKNDFESGNGNFYNYNSKAKTLTIFNTSLEGIEYYLKSIDKNRLVFSVPNKELNNYIDLVYNKVADKKAKEN